MKYKLRWNMLSEVALRFFLWCAFMWLEHSEPFIRHIQEPEMWKYQYPPKPSLVPATTLWFIIFALPATFFFAESVVTKSSTDPMQGFLGITLAYALNGLLTSYLKVLVGRPRPDFFYRCFPDGRGSDYSNCVGLKTAYLDGRKSFPSGHASFIFASMTFMCLYLGRKFGLFHNNEGKSWQLCVCLLPLVVAVAVAISRTCDYHHHYEDVAAGSLLGATLSYVCYKLYFPKVNAQS